MTVKITDIDGKKPSFTQWDVDRVLLVSGVDSKPALHFANYELKRSIVVLAEEDGDHWTCRVPNFILQFAGPMAVSVFLQPDDDEGKTVYTAVYNVQPKMKPQDYSYTENIGYINWVVKSQEVQDLIDTIQTMLDNGELKGDTGDPGVYIGTTPPTDPDVTVWIDPNGPSYTPGAIDEELSSTSENPVQNKVVKAALDTKADQASVEATIPPIVNTWLGNNIAQETGYVLDASLTMSNAAAPADKVGELRSATNEITVIPHTDHDGYIGGDGTIAAPTSTNEKYTDRVSVYPNGKIKVTLTYPTNQWMWLVYATYDNQGRFVSRITVPNSSGNQSIAEEFITIPANIYYVAFSYRSYSSAELTLKLYSSIKTYVDDSTDAKYTNPLNHNYASNITSISRSGMQPGYPLNSLFAFIAAYKAGFRTMLCPVRWTSDNIPVCLHDAQINVDARNTDGTVISDTIYIEDITLAQANQYDWGIKDSRIFKGMQLPTFESVVSFTKWMNCKLIVEIKGNPNETQLASLYNILRKYNMVDSNVMFSASYLTILEALQPLFPYSALGFGVAPSGITSGNIAALKSLKTQTNSVFFHVWRYNETSGIITDEMLNMLKGSNVGFALTEIQTDAAFESFISDANNAYVTMAAIRGKPIEQYLYDHFIT